MMAIGVAAFVVSRASGGTPGPPDQVIGYERLHAQQAQEFKGIVARPLADDLAFQGAAYGAGNEIELMLGTIEGDTGYGPEAIYFMVTRAIAGDAFASSLSGSIGERDYSCGGMGRGALCTWVGPEDTGFVAMPDTTPASLESVLPQVLDDIDG
jgi:hypothetical protein